MKRISVLALLLLGAAFLNAQDASADAVSAASIMNSAKNRNKTDTIISSSRIVITDKRGNTTERAIEQCSKDGPYGARTVIVFLRPAKYAGTRFLTMSNAQGGTDQWIYPKELRKLRKIVASEEGDSSFMGTDFSYDDISSMDRNISLDTHTLLREETFNGNTCYVIQSVPKDTSYQYSKTITWVDKESSLIYKAEMYNRRGELKKIMEMSDYRDIDGYLTPMQTKVSTVADGTSTTIYMENIKYNTPVNDNIFTPKFLETGRP